MKFNFGEGKDVEVGSLDGNQLCELEAKYGSLAKLGSDGKEIQISLVRYVAYIAVKKFLPEITEEQVGAQLNIDNIGEVAALIAPKGRKSDERPLP